MPYLLDSDVCVAALRRRASIIERLEALGNKACTVSTITVFELASGLAKAADPAYERQKIEKFLSRVQIMEFGARAAEFAGQARADLERQGKKIGPYDFLIAGQALAVGFTLATGNLENTTE